MYVPLCMFRVQKAYSDPTQVGAWIAARSARALDAGHKGPTLGNKKQSKSFWVHCESQMRTKANRCQK